MKIQLLVPVLGILIAGCTDSSNETLAVEPQDNPAATANEDAPATVFDSQMDSLDKARQVDDVLQKAAEAERLQIEQGTE